MLKITKKEVEYLKANGVPDHEDGISRTLGGTYYVCESRENMKLLKAYRNSIIVSSYKK